MFKSHPAQSLLNRLTTSTRAFVTKKSFQPVLNSQIFLSTAISSRSPFVQEARAYSTTFQIDTSKMAAQENKAAWLTAQGGPVEVGPASLWEPEKGQIRVKVFAAPLTPMDGLVSSSTPPVQLNYPTIPSSTVAGIVDSLGEGVTKVSVGDRVVSGTSIWTSKGNPKYGGVQRYSIVEEKEVIEIGDAHFHTAIATAIQTAAGALFSPLHLALTRPTNPASPIANGKKILIWGGASAMGAISISHAKAAGYTVITTASSKNFDFVKSRGADYVFDYDDVDAAVERIKGLFPIDYLYDCVGLTESMAALKRVAEAKLDSQPEGAPEIIIFTLTPPSMHGSPTYPAGIASKVVFFRNGAPENADLVEWMLKKGGYLETGVKEGWLRGVDGDVVGGLESVAKGLERRRKVGLKGVSAQRLIVEPWKSKTDNCNILCLVRRRGAEVDDL